MAYILKASIWAQPLVEGATGNSLGQKMQIAKGMAIEMGDDVPGATTIVINFNGVKHVADKALLRKAL